MVRDNRSESPLSPQTESEIPLDIIPLHSSNLLTVIDGSGIIKYESPAIERVFGFGQSELIGEEAADYFHPDDREEVISAFREVVNGDDEAVRAVEYRHRLADGSYKWVESVASGHSTPDGHYVVNTRDITAQQEREQHLAQMNERLEEFASIVSHDLRNPLNVAAGRLELAQEECDSPHLDKISTSLTRMHDLIEDVLLLSRAGHAIDTPTTIDLAQIVETCWGSVATGDATITIHADERVRGDRGRLRQLLENLFRNAIEHGGGEVTVTVGSLDSGFYVEDDGPGIPEDKRSWVLQAGSSESSTGTGLGLSIVNQIAHAHGWNIEITDASDGGARFEITDIEISP